MKNLYSIVDIETTGGRSRDNKITEIAIVVFDGEKVVKSFDSLINPERYIPLSITSLTGITNEMVEHAPKFYEIAKEIIETLEGTTFVAHNVFFDFNFIKKEFADLGYDFNMPKLCTVKLARKYIPGHKSYSLGRVCADLGIEIEGRHRALGDARATVELFKLILKASSGKELIDVGSEKRLVLPHGLSFDDLQALPSRCGLYYFLDSEQNVVYVGKSTDIQKRVRSHFYNKSLNKRQMTFKEKVRSFDTLVIGNEWVSLIIEACEIKRLRPPLNRSLNRSKFRFAVILDKKEVYWRLKIQTTIDSSCNNALMYRSRKTAQAAIEKFYNIAFGVSIDSIHWNTFIAGVPADSFNDSLEKLIMNRNYPHSDFDLKVASDIKNSHIRLEFRSNELVNIRFFTDYEQIDEYKVNEDPDVKRIILKKLNSLKNKCVPIQGEKEQGLHE